MHQRVPEVQRLLRMTLPRWPVGLTAVENRIEDSGRKCSGSRSGMVRRRRSTQLHMDGQAVPVGHAVAADTYRAG